ncbi:flavin reductase [Calditrichota bacterium]
MLTERLKKTAYNWPWFDAQESAHWTEYGKKHLIREMPEPNDEVAKDSRWPALFPSSISLVTTSDGQTEAIEKVVGACIVNRFPYVIALSFCRDSLSERHYSRNKFMEMLEKNGTAVVQFLEPGDDLDRVMQTIVEVPDTECEQRLAKCNLETMPAQNNVSPVFKSAYMAYEVRMVKPSQDFQGNPIYDKPWLDLGSHRVYFLEIEAIQLREDIADQKSRIYWRSLPDWSDQVKHDNLSGLTLADIPDGYKKAYTPFYYFPAENTIAFKEDYRSNGFSILKVPMKPTDEMVRNPDKARWPCFFPSSLGIISSQDRAGNVNVIPCGSTTVLTRHPFSITIAVAYADINERYAKRSSLDMILESGNFGCGVPFIHEKLVDVIWYTGNTQFKNNPQKVANTGLDISVGEYGAIINDLPIHFDCEVSNTTRLGTHILITGTIKHILIRKDLNQQTPLEWCPWADVVEVK